MLFVLKKFVAFWIMPVPACSAVLVLGLWMLRHRGRERTGKVLLIAGVVMLMTFGNYYVGQWLVRPLEARHPAVPELVAGRPVPAELAACRHVVVLGGGHGQSPGQPATSLLSPSALGRIVEAVRVLRFLPDAQLVVSGPQEGDRPSHAQVLADAAVSLGIDRQRIVLIDQARDTEDEAARVSEQVGNAPIALITSAWHMPRALALFRAAGIAALPCPADFRAHTDEDFRWSHLLWNASGLERSTLGVHEWIGRLWAGLRGKT